MGRKSTVYRHAFFILLLVISIWLAYGTSLNNRFAWDDYGLIVDNPEVYSQKGIAPFFFKSFWTLGNNKEDPTRNFYRPLISTSYKIDYQLHGMNPKGFHTTNMLVHTICAIAVYFLMYIICRQWGVAILASLIWAVHPTHVENVCWISGRTDLFCGLFYFLSLLAFLRWTKTSKQRHIFFWSIIVTFALALLCKEVAITLPFVCTALYFLHDKGKRSTREASTLGIAFLLTTSFYLAMRLIVLGAVTGSSTYGTIWERTISIPFVITKYIGLMLTIVPIDAHHNDMLLSNIFSISFLGSMLVCCAIALSFLWCVRKRMHTESFLLLWTFLALAPTFKLGAFGDIIYADRFLYIPSAAFFLFTATMANNLITKSRLSIRIRSAIIIICCVYIGILAIYSKQITAYWKNSHTLFYRLAQTSPKSSYIYYNLGNSLMRIDSCQEAYNAYVRCVELDPTSVGGRVNQAVVLNRMQRHSEAITLLENMRLQGHSGHILLAALGDAYLGIEQIDAALTAYAKSLRERKTIQVYNKIANLMVKKGKFDIANSLYIKAQNIESSPLTLNNLGSLSIEKMDFDPAYSFLMQARSFPSHYLSINLTFQIEYNLCRLFHLRGEHDESLIHADLALKLAEKTVGNESETLKIQNIVSKIRHSE